MSARQIVLSAALVLAGLGVAHADGDSKPKPTVAAKQNAKPAVTAKAKKKTGKVKSPRAKARRKLRQPAPRSLAEAARRLDRIRVDVEFHEASFQRVVEHIGGVATFNVIIAPALQADGLEGVSPITLKLKQVTLKQVTELVAKITGTSLKLRNRILQFTTKKDARGKPVLRIYSVAVLTAPIRNFPGPDLNLRPSGSEFEPEESTLVENSFEDPERIVEMIRELVAEDTWEDDDVSIAVMNGKLIVRQYRGVHRKIARLLAVLRSAR